MHSWQRCPNLPYFIKDPSPSSLLTTPLPFSKFVQPSLPRHTHTHTHTHTETTQSEARRLTHPEKYIFSPPVVSSQQLSLLHGTNNSLRSKIYFSECLFFSKIIHLTHTHTHTHSEKDNKVNKSNKSGKLKYQKDQVNLEPCKLVLYCTLKNKITQIPVWWLLAHTSPTICQHN